MYTKRTLRIAVPLLSLIIILNIVFEIMKLMTAADGTYYNLRNPIFEFIFLMIEVMSFVYLGIIMFEMSKKRFKDLDIQVGSFSVFWLVFPASYTIITSKELPGIPLTCPSNVEHEMPGFQFTCQMRSAALISVWVLSFSSFLTLFSMCFGPYQLLDDEVEDKGQSGQSEQPA